MADPVFMQRRPRVKDEKHLVWIRTMPCILSGNYGVDAAHIRYADLRYAKRQTGKGEKPDDRWTIPLARRFHDQQHSMDERAFWKKMGIDDICRVAIAMHSMTGDTEAAMIIMREATGGRVG